MIPRHLVQATEEVNLLSSGMRMPEHIWGKPQGIGTTPPKWGWGGKDPPEKRKKTSFVPSSDPRSAAELRIHSPFMCLF